MTNNIIIYGASGHGKVISDIILEKKELNLFGFCDDNKRIIGKKINNYLVHSFVNINSSINIIMGIGNNIIRKTIFERLINQNFSFVSVVHPTCIESPSVKIGKGTVVMPGTIINSCTKIGDNCIINSSACVDHDCRISNHSHVAPNATLCGGCSIGEGTFIGASATLIQGVRVGKNVVVGAGAVVTKDIPDNVTVVGIPAKKIN